MDNLKHIIAKNIAHLRNEKGMTQLELANTLNYSDKAVSKWERGESVPDVTVLKQIADLFCVTLDYLVQEDHNSPALPIEKKTHSRRKNINRKIVLSLSVILVWFVATLAFVITDSIIHNIAPSLMPFAYAVPITMLVWLIFNTIWFNSRSNYAIISLLMWSGLVVIYLNLLFFIPAPWTMFLLGIPGQIAIFLWSRFE